MEVVIFLVFIIFVCLIVKYKNELRNQIFYPDLPTTDTTLSLYGDSISYAAYLNPTPGEALSKHWTISNYAIAGMTFENLIEGFISSLQPNIVILPFEQQMAIDKNKVILVRLGINDCLKKNDLDDFADDLIEFITVARKAGHIPVLCGLTHTLDLSAEKRRKDYDSALRYAANYTQAHFIDIGTVSYSAGDLPDGLHPAQDYSSRLDEYIIRYLKENVFVESDK